jgi:hypothetical protein
VTAERDRIRHAYEQLKEHLELLRRRIFVAKAERVDVAQLELEFAQKKAELEELGRALDKERDDEEPSGDGPPPPPPATGTGAKPKGCGSSPSERNPNEIDHLILFKRGFGAGSGSGIWPPSKREAWLHSRSCSR